MQARLEGKLMIRSWNGANHLYHNQNPHMDIYAQRFFNNGLTPGTTVVLVPAVFAGTTLTVQRVRQYRHSLVH